jgi:hypothetical protein
MTLHERGLALGVPVCMRSVLARPCVFVCVCVRVRERETERVCVCVVRA